MVSDSIKVNIADAKRIESELLKLGFLIKVDTNPYLSWKLVGHDLTVMLYTSGKLVIQGNGDPNIIKNILGNADAGSSNTQDEKYVSHIGADEVGKGDYFGPLIVCAAYINDKNIEEIKKTGITDSKKITDEKILKIASEIEELVEYRVTVLSPSEYNDVVGDIGNVAIVLAQLHAENIRGLIEELNKQKIEYNKVVIDQFSTSKFRLSNVLRGITFDQFHKAESKDIVVATASVLARAEFVKYMDKMDKDYSFKFPYGASDVIGKGREFVEMFGIDKLRDVAKISFKTTKSVTNLF